MSGKTSPPTKLALYFAFTLSGAGGLSWEILWQHHSALFLGVSTYGTAITLASLMSGLGLGAFLVSRFAQRITQPLRVYAIAEVIVALGGLAVAPGLRFLGAIDPSLFARSPAAAWCVQIFGTAFFMMIPATAMGATLPALAPLARDCQINLSRLYAANTAGAVIGILLSSFVALPLLGVLKTSLLTAAIDIVVAAWAFSQYFRTQPLTHEEERNSVAPRILALAFYTGFAVFVLEVGWFRSLRAAFQSSTESFAIMLAAFILPLALAAALAPRLKDRPFPLAWFFALAGFFALVATPLVDRMDEWLSADFYSPLIPLRRFGLTFLILALPVGLIGVVFPTLLLDNASSKASGRLFAANTLGAICGTLCAGFILLPAIGATWTCWSVGVSMMIAALIASTKKIRIYVPALTAAGFVLAFQLSTGSARTRVQGFGVRNYNEIAFVSEGPDSTVWVARDNRSGSRKLIIDGFEASGEHHIGEHYMRWMGHLPALALGGPIERALVICFGTGQTANAVRQHRPARLDIADINPAVFRAASLFPSNENVLQDPAVHHYVMDGRKFLQRSQAHAYDLITLEPMPPNFAGVNNLYSREFYELARAYLQARGIIAQWLPIHLLASTDMLAILASFIDVFPYSRLWMDPVSGTGIIVGGVVPWQSNPTAIALDMTPEAIAKAYLLDAEQIKTLVASSARVTDDNQLLAYGFARLTRSTSGKHWFQELYRRNFETLKSARK